MQSVSDDVWKILEKPFNQLWWWTGNQ